MMNIRTAASVMCLLATTHLMAGQEAERVEIDNQMVVELPTQYEAAIDSLVADFEARQASDETMMNPRMIRLFGKATLYKSSVSNALKREEAVELYASSGDQGCLALATDSRIGQQQQMEEAIDQAVLHASMTNPEDFSYTEEKFNENVTVVESVEKQQTINNIQPTILLSENQQNQAVGVDMKVKKPNFWKTTGETWLQFQQNYVSGNWSQGGESTNTLQSGLILTANYNDQRKVQWDNMFEGRLGFTTAPSDTEHEYRINTDMLRLSSKLLLKAIRSWNYSFEVTSQTQSLRSYPTNSEKYISAFLAPLDTRVSIGMDYKKSVKNFNISVNLAPLSYRWLYVSEKHLGGRYGIKGNHRSLQEYGSSTNINSSWQITKNIRWTSHIDAFTSYEKLVANWENTIDFAVNKYLSTKLFFHGRFDDGVRKKDGYSYFQFKEFLQFGLSYKW
ncbi:MAG: DUF3078 domain-containing protein [Bacteroidaceae bacterium]|nr:DUF3078 domain-containing protein [Bacteroidaceae bacterium]